MYYIGIDVGGTNLKAGLVNEAGEILAVSRIPLNFTTAQDFAGTLADLSKQVLSQAGIEASQVNSVGMGIPGAVEGGNVLYTANIPMRDVPLEALFRQHLDIPVTLANDADCAAAAEFLFGCGKGSSDFVMVTLGTGVGGGLILGGRLHTGKCCAGEVGHMVIDMGGEACGCGRQGCWEAYASATGLIRMAEEAKKLHPDSGLGRLPVLNGQTIFEEADRGDKTALEVTEKYVRCLSVGITNLVNILQPEVVAIGGGVAAAPAHLLLDQVQKLVTEHCYGRHVGHYPKILRASMGNDAGIVGAALISKLK